jgi:hypothetical protein
MQRRRGHRKAADSSVIHVEMESRSVIANLVDVIGGGCGLALLTALKPGSSVVLRGKFGENHTLECLKAGVKWCSAQSDGTFRAGLEFIDQDSTFTLDDERADGNFYEVMQLSPNADGETISRVYRLLAFRYHPDNKESGNSDMFLRLSAAYEILSDPKKRASYDAAHRASKPVRTKAFTEAATPARSDREKRRSHENVMAAYLGVRSRESTVSWEG